MSTIFSFIVFKLVLCILLDIKTKKPTNKSVAITKLSIEVS